MQSARCAIFYPTQRSGVNSGCIVGVYADDAAAATADADRECARAAVDSNTRLLDTSGSWTGTARL
jgi:hypothetical protein